MKKFVSIFSIILVIIGVFSSCGKENTKVIIENSTDSVFIFDTIFIHDTISNSDTLFVIDSILTFDTIVIVDTIIIHDTSEFNYLFKHYDLDEYEVLFYTIDLQKSPTQICKMNSNSHNIDIITDGYQTYPIWAEDGESIYYIDFDNYALIKKNLISDTIPDILVYELTTNMMFLFYQKNLDVFLFSDKSEGDSKIAALDYHTGEIIELTEAGSVESNPVSSKVDDWIYYSSLQNGTYDIYRKKIDKSQVEAVYSDANYNLSTFNVSADGKFLITPKYNNGKGVVVFYDINRHQIIHELELPVEGHPLYATLSDDNKAIFFVNGTPYNYSEPRNIFRMALDRTQLFQLTSFQNVLASRPLIR